MFQIKIEAGQQFHQDRCRCCLTSDRFMVSVHTASTHNDNKTLDDYLNVLFSYSCQGDWIYPSHICLRCSKALEVAYHFMLMSLENKRELEVRSRNPMRIMRKPMEGESDAIDVIIEIPDTNETNGDMGNSIEGENEVESSENWNDDSEGKSANTNNNSEEIMKPEAFAETDGQVIEPTYATDCEEIRNSFKCCYCEDIFTLHESLIEHTQRIHKKMIPFKCRICNFQTCFMESLRKHYEKQHKLDDVENRLYKTKELLALSAEVQTNYEITLKCHECPFQTHTQNEMDEHLSLKHGIRESKDTFTSTWYNCPSCYRQFINKTSAKIHYSMSHKPQQALRKKVYTCEKCGKTFNLKTSIMSHERHCELRDSVLCNLCGLEFSSVFKYEQHLQTIHSVDVRHECEMCQKTFKTSSSLACHRKRHNERHYQCHLCSKDYINNAELEVHRKRIHGRGPYKVCSICKKTFVNLKQLREHTKKEHSKKSIQCGYCEYTSTSKFAIEVHQYRHTGRPFKCKCCRKKYVLRKDLKDHCKKAHGFLLTDEELAAMFVDKHGYPSRFDTFSKQNKKNGYPSRFDTFSKQNTNNNTDLLINVVDEMNVEMELREFNLTFQDIIKDLFDNKEAMYNGDVVDWEMK